MTRQRTRIGRFARGLAAAEKGSALAELAIVLPMLCLLLAGLIEVGIEQCRLRRLGPVKVGVEAAVEQVDRLEIDCERSFPAASEKLLGDRYRVVVRDQDGRADTLVCPY